MEHRFIEPVPDDCHCTICGSVLTQPVLTECCGQHFCEACLQSWFQTGPSPTQTCPHCRRERFRHIRSLPMSRKISELRVACPLRSLGCEDEFPLKQVDAHLSSCGWVLMHCSNSCGKMIYRKDLNEHLYECLQRPIRRQVRNDIITDSECHMTRESSTSYSSHAHFSWISETALCTPTIHIDEQEAYLLLELTHEHGPRELLRKKQDGTLSLVLGRKDSQPSLNSVEIRMEEVVSAVSARHPPPPPLRSIQTVCDRCNAAVTGNDGDGVVFVARIFGHHGLKERLKDGCDVVITVTKHNCTDSNRTHSD